MYRPAHRPARRRQLDARQAPGHHPAPLTLEEALETTKIHSIVALLAAGQALITRRPFRAPHHTASDAGLLGGNGNPTPSEISLAHNGVLFLDELPEFKRNVLETMRQPLEEGRVTISRTARHDDLSLPIHARGRDESDEVRCFFVRFWLPAHISLVKANE